MHQWLTTLRVQVLPGDDELRVIIKVQMSDECYQQHDSLQRKQLIEQVAMETVVSAGGNQKIWKTRTAPCLIEPADTYLIAEPKAETEPPDHWTFSALSA